MARIKIKGKAKKVSTTEVREATSFFCDQEMKRLSKTVYVEVKLTKDLFKKTGHFGYATWIDDDARNHREFEIEVDAGLGPVFLFRTIAHEIVHCRQYARKELVDMCYGNYQKWKGFLVNESLVNYSDLPWEKEAHIIEKIRYQQWKTFREKIK